MEKCIMKIGKNGNLEFVGIFQQRVLVVPTSNQDSCYVVNLAESAEYDLINFEATLFFSETEAMKISALLNECMMNVATLDQLKELHILKHKMLHQYFQVGHAK